LKIEFLLQAHSTKYYIQNQSEIHISERACNDHNQPLFESFKGTFAASGFQAANVPYI
jgi:hypothetical protein